MRHSALIPLSHDHHEALLVCLRLKKGGPSSAHDTLWPKDPTAQVDALLRFAERELYPHFELEESLLFPKANTPELASLVAILLEDHRHIKAELSQIALKREDPQIAEILAEFGRMLDDHIRREERQVFPLFEAEVEAGRLSLEADPIKSRQTAYRG